MKARLFSLTYEAFWGGTLHVSPVLFHTSPCATNPHACCSEVPTVLNPVFMPAFAHADPFCLEITCSTLCYLTFFLVKKCPFVITLACRIGMVSCVPLESCLSFNLIASQLHLMCM